MTIVVTVRFRKSAERRKEKFMRDNVLKRMEQEVKDYREYLVSEKLTAALLNDPEILIVDEPTTGLDPEERIRIRNLLVDFSEGRTVLFSTHVVEDLAATCSRLAVMKKGRFLFSGRMKELLKEAEGCVWICETCDENTARDLEKKYRISSKQFVDGGLQMRIIFWEEGGCLPPSHFLLSMLLARPFRDGQL